MAQGRKAGVLSRGNGCALHGNCFTCPGPDSCAWPLDGDIPAKQKAIREWLPCFNEKEEIKLEQNIKCQVEGCTAPSRYGLYRTNADGTKEWIKVCKLHEGEIGNENQDRAGGRYTEEDRKRNSK